MFDILHLSPEDGPSLVARTPNGPRDLLDVLDLAPTPQNALAVAWTRALGEFRGLRIEAPVRMTDRVGACL